MLPVAVVVIIPGIILIITGIKSTSPLLLCIFGVLVAAAGLILFLWTIWLLEHRGNGTLAPWAPTSTLVTYGPYAHIRNPMITGVLLIIIGMGMMLWNIYLLVWAAFFFAGNTIYFKYSEEPGLKKRFGRAFEEYAEKVPMWIPRLKRPRR